MKSAVILLLLAATPALAQPRHPCAADAIAKAIPLLTLHFGEEPKPAAGIDGAVKVLAPIKALKGDGRFDVLEVLGHIYKTDYRMRFIYAQTRGSCLLMGQEILEVSNPY